VEYPHNNAEVRYATRDDNPTDSWMVPGSKRRTTATTA
jgi:hypothetical protein